jgi:hypothetical protein
MRPARGTARAAGTTAARPSGRVDVPVKLLPHVAVAGAVRDAKSAAMRALRDADALPALADAVEGFRAPLAPGVRVWAPGDASPRAPPLIAAVLERAAELRAARDAEPSGSAEGGFLRGGGGAPLDSYAMRLGPALHEAVSRSAYRPKARDYARALLALRALRDDGDETLHDALARGFMWAAAHAPAAASADADVSVRTLGDALEAGLVDGAGGGEVGAADGALSPGARRARRARAAPRRRAAAEKRRVAAPAPRKRRPARAKGGVSSRGRRRANRGRVRAHRPRSAPTRRPRARARPRRPCWRRRSRP